MRRAGLLALLLACSCDPGAVWTFPRQTPRTDATSPSDASRREDGAGDTQVDGIDGSAFDTPQTTFTVQDAEPSNGLVDAEPSALPLDSMAEARVDLPLDIAVPEDDALPDLSPDVAAMDLPLSLADATSPDLAVNIEATNADLASDLATAGSGDASTSENVEAGAVAQICVPRDIAMDSNPQTADGSDPNTRCNSTNSVLKLTYSIDVGTWGGCVFATDDYAHLFDSDQAGGGQGVIEVRTCVVGQPATGSLNLYYGLFPARRWFSLYNNGTWANGQVVATDQCMTLRFRPPEANYPGSATTDAGTYPPVTCPATPNSCGEHGNSCEPSGGFAPTLMLIGEWPAAQTSGVVKIAWVRYYPAGCNCEVDTDCSSNTTCTTFHNNGDCSAINAPGVCADCIGRGDPCQVTALGKTCQASLICVQGAVQCPCSPE